MVHPHSPVYPVTDLPRPFLHLRCGGGGSGSSDRGRRWYSDLIYIISCGCARPASKFGVCEPKMLDFISKMWRLWPAHIRLLKLIQCALARITPNNYDDIHYMNLTPLCSLISLQSDCCNPYTICLLLNTLLCGWQFDVWLTKAHRWVRTILQYSDFLPDWLSLLIIEHLVTWLAIWCLTDQGSSMG